MPSLLDSDPLLRRLERRALLFCLGAAGVALAVRPDLPSLALGVLGGGVLAGLSYWAIRSSVSTLVERAVSASVQRDSTGSADAVPRDEKLDADGHHIREEPTSGGAAVAESDTAARATEGGAGARFIALLGRYALLGLGAYAMIARLRLHPVGLLIGISSPFAAASFEALRVMWAMGRRGPRA